MKFLSSPEIANLSEYSSHRQNHIPCKHRKSHFLFPLFIRSTPVTVVLGRAGLMDVSDNDEDWEFSALAGKCACFVKFLMFMGLLVEGQGSNNTTH